MTETTEDQREAEDSAPEEEPKVLTNSRWQDGNKIPRYDRNQTRDLETILGGKLGFVRGARINHK